MNNKSEDIKNLDDKLKDLMQATNPATGEAGGETGAETLDTGPRVLLAAKAKSENDNAFKYALNVCKRLGSQLDVLYISSKESLDPEIAAFLSLLTQEKIPWRFIQKDGCLKNQIIDYTEKNNGIMFVVTESSDNLDIDCRRHGSMISEAWENLKCPLVVVSSAE